MPGRMVAVTLSLACLAGGAVAHPVSMQMAYIGEADDGLTRQSVDALARPEPAVHKLPPPSEYSVEVVSEAPARPRASQHAVAHHRRHHLHRAVAAASTPKAASRKPGRSWLMVKLIAFTNWWNGWAERNLHTAALDVHLDRSAQHDA